MSTLRSVIAALALGMLALAACVGSGGAPQTAEPEPRTVQHSGGM